MKEFFYLPSIWRRATVGLAGIILLLFSSCSDNDVIPDPKPENEFLVDAELVYTATSSQIKLVAQFSGLGLNISEFKYDVEIFNVTYKTSYKGTDVIASGLIALPKTTQDVGMLSFQHATITVEEDAPSNFSSSDPDALSNALLYGSVSSSGFITVIPDYLGFGTSSSILHPYYVEEFTAAAVIDMIKAAAELAVEKDVHFNSKLFLAGYSEGGYATMAVHKSIEENQLKGFELIASFAGAGGYDVKGMQEYFFGLDTYPDPYYIAYIVRAYQLNYDQSTLLTDFFKEPYSTRIPSLFDGLKNSGEINAQLTNTLSDLIQDDISNNINTAPKYKYIVDALNENSLTGWAPHKKMYLYHGQSDTTVPYQNSTNTYNALLSHGASSEILTLIPLTGDHISAVTPYITDFVPKLWALR